MSVASPYLLRIHENLYLCGRYGTSHLILLAMKTKINWWALALEVVKVVIAALSGAAGAEYLL